MGLRWDDGVIGTLRLQNFRCAEALSLDLAPGASIFVGENAQGKTTLLEAVCVLVRLHSPRTHRLGQVVRMGESGFGVAGDCWGSARRVEYGPEGLLMKVDGEAVVRQGDYLGAGGLVVWMGNEDLELVRGPGEARRRYLDFAASQIFPGYLRDLTRYRRALRARNLLLKDRQPDPEQVGAYTAILIEHGESIQRARATLVEALGPEVGKAHRSISGGREEAAIDYGPAGGPDLAASFAQAEEREWRVRQTVVGPHRDDLGLHLNGLAAADFASEGQQRTLALALKLAQGVVLEAKGGGLAPVYLIDDIFGELDPARRNALLGELPEGAQKLITTTSVAWMDEEQPEAEVFRVQAGSVGRA